MRTDLDARLSRRLARMTACLLVGLVVLAGCGDDDDAADSPAEVPETTVEGTTSDLSGRTLRIGTSGSGIDDLPLFVAIELLEEQGIEVEMTDYAEQEETVRAMASGDIDVTAFIASSTAIGGINQGAAIDIIAGYTKHRWALVGATGFDTVESLEGRRVGVHSESSFTKAVADHYLDTYQIDAEVLIVPGSEVRAQALANGQLDATVISLDDFLFLSDQFPGAFTVISEFGDELPDLISGVTTAAESFLEEQPDLALAYLVAYLEGIRTVNDLEEAQRVAVENIADSAPSAELLQQQVEMLVSGGFYPEDGHLSEATCSATLTFLIEAEQVEAGGSSSDDETYCRYDLLEQAKEVAG